MKLQTEFVVIPLERLRDEAAIMKAQGWRFIQTHAVNTDAGIDLYYSFMKDGLARNFKIEGVTKDDAVPSITDMFLAAFVFENEARELFGVDMRDIALDFKGALYAPAEREPMTFITPEQKAMREKAAKAAAAKAAKEEAAKAGSGAPSQDAPAKHVFVMTPERRARLDAKLATMSPDKVAKVEAALKAREAEAAQASAAPAAKPAQEQAPKSESASEKPAKPVTEQAVAIDHVLEEKISHMDPEKAAKVRAALARKSGNEAPGANSEPLESADVALDSEVEAKLAMMSAEKADKVRAAFDKARNAAAVKEGE